jgi:hypothetical protein
MKIVDIDVRNFLLGVGDGGAENFFDDQTEFFPVRKMQDGQRFSHKAVADKISHQPAFPGGHPDIPG